MKKDMFYNYDHHINDKINPYNIPSNKSAVLEGYTGQWLVYDYKGNEIGLRAYKGTPIHLHFNFSGTVDECCNIGGFLNNNTIKLEIVDCFHNVLIEKSSLGEVVNNSLEFEIVDVENKLKKDTYYMNLYILLETGEKYNLYNEKDGSLYII